MAYIEPTPEELQAFAAGADDNRPIVMINLLRFREQAAYPAASEASPCSGREAYRRYGKSVLPLLWEVGGNILLGGKVRFALIGPADEQWDEFVLAAYPSRAAFLRMIESPAYQQIVVHRQAALADSRLLETRLDRLPRALLAGARQLIRARAWLRPRIA